MQTALGESGQEWGPAQATAPTWETGTVCPVPGAVLALGKSEGWDLSLPCFQGMCGLCNILAAVESRAYGTCSFCLLVFPCCLNPWGMRGFLVLRRNHLKTQQQSVSTWPFSGCLEDGTSCFLLPSICEPWDSSPSSRGYSGIRVGDLDTWNREWREELFLFLFCLEELLKNACFSWLELSRKWGYTSSDMVQSRWGFPTKTFKSSPPIPPLLIGACWRGCLYIHSCTTSDLGSFLSLPRWVSSDWVVGGGRVHVHTNVLSLVVFFDKRGLQLSSWDWFIMCHFLTSSCEHWLLSPIQVGAWWKCVPCSPLLPKIKT